jgi:hypothetical protein
MKKIKILIATTLAMIIICSNVHAQVADLSLTTAGNKSFTISSNSKDAIELAIHDRQGQQLHQEITTQDVMNTRQYNLKNFPDGTYHVRIKSGATTFLQHIELVDNEIKIPSKSANTLFQPNIVQKGSKVDINMLCLGDASVVVSVKDENADVVFVQKMKAISPLTQRFDLSRLPVGVYNVEVRASSMTFTESFSKQVDVTEDLVLKF